MESNKKKVRFTPFEVAKELKLSPAKFYEMVNDGTLPKGRIGEDNKRYYTPQDLEFMRREWHAKTTGRFILFTLPVILISIAIIIITLSHISSKISDRIENSNTTPTPKIGFAAPPVEIWSPGTPWPTRLPRPTATAKPLIMQEFSSPNIEPDNVPDPIRTN